MAELTGQVQRLPEAFGAIRSGSLESQHRFALEHRTGWSSCRGCPRGAFSGQNPRATLLDSRLSAQVEQSEGHAER